MIIDALIILQNSLICLLLSIHRFIIFIIRVFLADRFRFIDHQYCPFIGIIIYAR